MTSSESAAASDSAPSFRARRAAIIGKIAQSGSGRPLASSSPVLIAVSKFQSPDRIAEALEAGHRVFGENRIQEALGRWQPLREEYADIELHFIGSLQSNKVKEAVELFDVIQTVDREKLVIALCREMQKQGRTLPCFIQVNTGDEPQKSGTSPDNVGKLISFSRERGLNICGLMCIPPAGEPPAPHFALLRQLALRNGISQLSMGMSRDFAEAVRFGATHIRVGTALFGERM